MAGADGDVAQPRVWLRFFGRSLDQPTAPGPAATEALFNVYAHHDASQPSASSGAATSAVSQLHGARNVPGAPSLAGVRHPFWRAALLPASAHVATSYRNGTSLELARMA